MKLSDGIEQALHSVTLMAALPKGALLPASALADFHGVSKTYLLKHLQALSRAKIVETLPGPKGGYRLQKHPSEISVLDVILAIEGPEPAFRCKEIRQNGPNPLNAKYFKMPCQINAAMLRAERAYRNELRQISIMDLNQNVEQTDHDGAIAKRGCAFFEEHMRQSNS
ncbi:RrF2 family transcriptional regulator [Epibacterium ulvae]|uniref:RrF2 family transcriptional regulator n=1 Tax=Epibacterium ulvae TaxID=1156985 RepID=UPI002492C1AB|nr:Rrf2 family transcriptional regulator [Epibacterium ulvae]